MKAFVLFVVIAMAGGPCRSPAEPTTTTLADECAHARKRGVAPGFSCHGFESYRLNGIAICRYDAKGRLIPGFDGTGLEHCAAERREDTQ